MWPISTRSTSTDSPSAKLRAAAGAPGGRRRAISAIAWTLLGLVFLGLTVVDILAPDQTGSGPVFSMRSGDRAGSDPLPTSRILLQRLIQATTQAGSDPLAFRRILAEERMELNAEIINQAVVARLAWIRIIDRGFQLAALAGLVLLFGPLWIARRSGGTRPRQALATVPYFTVTSAAIMLLTSFLCSIVISVQSTQVVMASMGNVGVATVDAVVHYLVSTSDKNLVELLGLLARGSATAQSNPFEGPGALANLYLGFEQARDSDIFIFSGHLLQHLGLVVEAYAPMLAMLVLLVTLGIAAPVVANLVRYPAEVFGGRDQRSLGRFAWEQAKVLWREIRAFLWMLMFILLFTACAAVLVRLLLYPLVVAAIRVLLSTVAHLAQGGSLPDLGVFFSLLSIAVTLVACFFFVFAPAALVVSKAYRMVRTRLYTRRPFRQFPEFWRLMRGFFLHVTGLAIISLGLVLGLCFGLWTLVEDGLLRVWLPALVLAPVFLTLVWRLKLLPRMLALIRVDACALPALNLHPVPRRRYLTSAKLAKRNS